MINVLFPTATEALPFVNMLDGAEYFDETGVTGWRGVFSGREVSVLVSGAGQVNAARTMTSILEKGGPGLVLLGGCAGAYAGSGLGVGDVALASEEVFAGLGVDGPGGFITLEEVGLPLLETGGRRYFDAMPLPASAGLNMQAISEGVPRVMRGRSLTVTTVTGTAVGGDMLFARYGALCENMEGAAAAQVALVYGAPFIEVRGISNMAMDRDREGWDIPLASANSARVIANIIRGWRG